MRRSFFSKPTLKSMTVLLGLVAVCFMASCSKDKVVTPATPAGKTAKFTITVNGALSSDYVSFVFAGGDAAGNNTLWKVNGVTRDNEPAISLDVNDFTGGTHTYVIESTMPLAAISTSVQCLTYGSQTYTVSNKAEIDGVVKTNDQNVTVTETNDYTHQYSY